MRTALATLALLLLTGAQTSLAEAPRQLTLTGGATVGIPDTDITLLLTGITDQRCPAKVDCFWEGMIRAEITVRSPDEVRQVILCNLCDDGGREATGLGVTVSLVGLAPSTEELDKLGRAPLLSDYVLTVDYKPAP